MKLENEETKGKTLSWALQQGPEVKIALLRHYQEMGCLLAQEIMEEEVQSLAGPRYTRNKPQDGRYSRWGSNPGSIQMDHEKVPIETPRIYDHYRGGTVGLGTYQKLHKIESPEEEVLNGIIKGLSMADYRSVVQCLSESFGLSRSNVSLRFIEESSAKLNVFEERRLDDYRFAVLFIDGKYLAREQIVIVVGVTGKGDKMSLGFIQTNMEHSIPIKGLLTQLVERGLKYEHGLLCVVDGSKGIYKTVVEIFGEKVVIQRCQWHKRENVLSYLK